MDAYINSFVNALIPILVTFITGVASYAVKKSLTYLETKLGNEQYLKLKNFAQDAWYITEEYFRLHPELKTGMDCKINMFAGELRKKVPGITDQELEILRQSLAGAINKDKPDEVRIGLQPQIKYYTKEGIELRPVNEMNNITK